MEIVGNGSFIRKLISCIKDFTESSNIIINKNSFEIQAMDNAHVAVMYVRLNSDFFDNFKCEQDLSLGLNFETLHKILKVNKSDLIKFHTENDDSLCIDTIDSFSSHSFEMKLMDIEVDLLQIHELDFTYIATIDSKKFHHLIKELSEFGENCEFICSEDNLTLKVEGDYGITTAVIENIIINCKQEITLKFAFTYLLSITSFQVSETLLFKLGEDIPLCVEYPINDGKIIFFLAPKLSDMEEI